MRILIATGIYPPDIGGPAEYAKNLESVWKNQGNMVEVSVFSRWNFLPTGLRHIVYFFSVIPAVLRSDFVLALDTFSSAFPALVASKIFNKKIIVRTGGDFLWEWYVERTGDMVPLKDFYSTRKIKFSLKENVVFFIIKFILKNVHAIIWSTEFQKEIFMTPYELQGQNHFVIENYYGEKLTSNIPVRKNFISSSRAAKLKNSQLLHEIFNSEEMKKLNIELETERVEHDELMRKIQNCYAVIVPSVTEISPNLIIESISFNKPFIVTKEVGTYPRIKDVAIFIDPLNRTDIVDKVTWLCEPSNYNSQVDRLKSFNFIHTWEEIASEYVEVYKKIK